MPRTACLERLRTGGLVLVVDSALEPPEAALVCAAARVTPEAINLMTLHTRGLVCLALPRERMRRLGIPLLVPDRGGTKPAYGVSIEACRGVSTGISAADRTATVLAAVAPDATPADLVMPGHVTPIEITPGGTLVRAALPEAASDLVRLATADELAALAARLGVPAVSVTDVVQMRLRSDTLVRRVAEGVLPLADGPTFRAIVYANSI